MPHNVKQTGEKVVHQRSKMVEDQPRHTIQAIGEIHLLDKGTVGTKSSNLLDIPLVKLRNKQRKNT